MLLQLKASAGSGKTYALTERLLRLFHRVLPTADASAAPGLGAIGSACALRPAPSPSEAPSGALADGGDWTHVRAVTFTNKAAEEMRERLIVSLKTRALKLPAPVGAANDWTPDEAERQLVAMLEDFERLGVGTIDGFLGGLAKVFALELGLAPDFVPEFTVEEIFDPAYDRFLAECEAGDATALSLLTACMDGLGPELTEGVEQDEDAPGPSDAGEGGFLPATTVRGKLFEALRAIASRPEGRVASPDRAWLERLRADRIGTAIEAANALASRIASDGLACDSRFLTFLAKCRTDDQILSVSGSTYPGRPTFVSCVNKPSKHAVTDRHEALWKDFRTAFDAAVRTASLADSALRMAPFVDLALAMQRHVQACEWRKSACLHDALAPRLAALLEAPDRVAEAFCRMGGRIRHILVDEFQDTSRDQWAVLAPVAEECLSSGGMVGLIGDPKQAIYAWRGGEFRLFDEVFAPGGPLALLAKPVPDRLESNWRSAPAVTGFNNDFFARFGEEESAIDAALTLIPDAPDRQARFVNDLQTMFTGADQEVPKQLASKPGAVLITRVAREAPDDEGPEDFRARMIEALVHSLKHDVLLRRPPGEVAVLTRTNAQAEEVAARFMAEGWQVMAENSLKLAAHPVIAQLTDLLATLDDSLDDAAFARFLRGRELFQNAVGLNPEAVDDWLVEVRARTSRDRTNGDSGRRPLVDAFREAFPDIWRTWLTPLFRPTGLPGPYALAVKALHLFRVRSRRPGDDLAILRFLEIVFTAEEQGRSLTAFLESWRADGAEDKAPSPENLPAIRIMTVHKAKGLQFPVVLAPIFDSQRGGGSRPLGICEIEGREHLVRPRKAHGVCWSTPEDAATLESLTALYVAFTRPESELRIFLAHGDKKVGKLTRLIEKGLDDIQAAEVRELGAATLLRGNVPPDAPGREVAARSPASPPCLPSRETEPGAGEARMPHPASRRVETGQEGGQENETIGAPGGDAAARARGELLHRVMELLTPTGDNATTDAADAARAVRAALAEPRGLWADAETRQAATRACLFALSVPEVRTALVAGRREAEILTVSGRLKRVDLLLETAETVLVVEYKTGQATGERRAGHLAQVRDYLGLLAEGPAAGRQARGLLVYLEQREVERV